jgi:hypothetical protein
MPTFTRISKPFGSGNYKSVICKLTDARIASPPAWAEQKLAVYGIASLIDPLRANQFGPKG